MYKYSIFCCYLITDVILPKDCCDATYKCLRCVKNKKLPYVNNGVFLDV